MTATLALLVQIEENYGSYRAVARPTLVQENGEMHNISWSGYGVSYGDELPDVQRFDGLEITAYAGDSWSSGHATDNQRLWGFGVHYAPHRVENGKHAQAIARTFGQIERGMTKAEAEDGYVRDGEFARYVMRAARALKIRKVYVRNTPRAYAMSGERYRLADMAMLDYWTQEVTERIVAGDLATLVRG